jgi:dolichyl-diphosphooligosaccharide--protein glycosyltransferase
LPGLLDFFSKVDTKFWYPEGRNFAQSTFAGLYYFSAISYIIVTSLGINISLYEFLVILPAFMGAAITIPIFLIGRRLGGNFVGGLGAIIVSLIPGFLGRSSFGWYDNEPFALLFGLTGLYFTLHMLEEKKMKEGIVFSILAGLLVGYANTIWGGARILNGLVGIVLLVAPFITIVTLTLIRNVTLFTLAEIAIAGMFPKPGIFHWMIDPSNLMIYLALLLNLTYFLLKTRYHVKSAKTLYLLSGIIIVVGIILILLISPQLLTHRYLSVLNPFFRSSEPIVQSVAEHQTTTGLEFLYSYNILLFIGILGGYILLRRRDLSSTTISLFFLMSLYLASSFARLQVYLALALPLVFAAGLSSIYKNFSLKRKDKKRRKEGALGSYYKTLTSIMIILILASIASINWIPNNDRGTQISSSATILSKSKVTDWIEALSWIRENVPPNSIVVSWWDYGYWITVMGNRTTIADNGTLNTTRIEKIATMFLSNETEAVRIMKELQGDYVVVFVTSRRLGDGYEVIGRVYSLGGDESKVDWMIAIAGLNKTKYIDEETSMPNQYFWNNTLIGKLMPYEFLGYGQIDRSGRLVNITSSYDPESTYYQLPLFRYKIKYNDDTAPFKLVFKSSAQLHTNNIYAQVLIYKFNG